MAEGPKGGGSPGRNLARQHSRTLKLKRSPSPRGRDPRNDWPTKCASKGVEESDGAFFESFTALVWKQENRRRRAASEDESGKGRGPPLENQFVQASRGSRGGGGLSRKEFELLYIEVLYTVKHKVGTTSGHHLPFMQDLYLYARDAFGVTPEEHARLLARASEEKPPVLILNVTVVEARGLEAKDADGFSDPYCMLGIVPGSLLQRERFLEATGSCSSDEECRVRKESALKKFSQSFKKKDKKDKTARDTIPAKFIRTTSVMYNTLDPVWHERFRFDLEGVECDKLHLDIWDHDDEFSVVDAAKRLNEVAGFKGLGRYFKQIAQSARTSGTSSVASKASVDDFLGSVTVNLTDIPSTGLDEWFDLDARSSRSNVEGQIHLRFDLATREDRGYSEEDAWDEIREHQDLMGVFIEHELKSFKGEIYHWRGNLSQAAQTILHQHAIQGDITDEQQAMCRWAAYSKKHRQHPFDWMLLLELLVDLDEKWEPASLNKDDEEALAESFMDFLHYCLNLISNQRDIYPPHNKIAQVRFECMLKCLAKMYDMPCFAKCLPFAKVLNNEVANAIKKSALDWYERVRNSTVEHAMRDDETIVSLIELTNRLNLDLQKGLTCFNPVYEKILGLNYFNSLYRQLDKLLGEDITTDLKNISGRIPEVTEQEADTITAQDMGLQLFELYLTLQEFCSYKQHLSSSERKSLAVIHFYELFRVPVQRWINVCKYKLMRRVRKSVELDKEMEQVAVEQVDGHVKQSTSAVDVACCFGQIVDFWKSIEWPDHPGALPFVTKITEDMCLGATFYADLIHAKLQGAGYYDEVGQFDVTEQLCITINDIEQVRRALRPLPEALQFSQIAGGVERSDGEKAGKQTKARLLAIVKAADEDMVHKIKQVVDRVADKMRPDIKKDVFHLCWAPEKQPAETAIGDLMNYLDSNLVTLNTNLFRSNFDRILDSIWVEVLEEMRDVLDNEDVKANWFFERLFEALTILVEFFHANDKGLPLEVIKNSLYKELHRQLGLNKATTKDLFEIFYMEKLEEQERTVENKFGSLSVRVYYNTDAEILSVEVLNAKSILPLDPNGLSDPFVLIEICPHNVFPKQTVQQTQIIKKTLNPIFDESFEFCVSPQQCMHRGASVHFTVMDHDFLLTNDFAGEAFLSLNNIPGISGEEVSGFSVLKPITLLLTQPKKTLPKTRAKGAIRALAMRDTDKEAQEFVKKRRDIEAQSQL